MADLLALNLAERFWTNKSSFTHRSLRVVVLPGTSLHRVKVTTARSERVVTVTMNPALSGAAYAASRVGDPTGAFDLPGLTGIINVPGWVGINEQGKPYYWLHVILAESDPATISVEGATAEEYSERVVHHDPSFRYVLTETSAQGEWATDFVYFNGGNMAELVARTTGSTTGGGTSMPWTSIIMFILSFVLSKKSGRSTAAAALTGLAVGGATYVLGDPSNPDNLFGIGVDSASTQPGTKPAETKVPTGSAGAASLGQVVGGAVNSAGNALTNMGPGTAALVGGAAGLTLGSGSSSWIVWGLVAVGAILILKD